MKKQISRVEYPVTEVKKWKRATIAMTMREIVKATGIGEVTLRNAILHGWGTEETRQVLNGVFASKKQPA